MIGGEFLRRVYRWARRDGPTFEFTPERWEGQPFDLVPGKPSHGAPAWPNHERTTGVRTAAARRRRQGFLADDVGISMYLGTRGMRGL